MSSRQVNDIALPPLSGPMLILAAVMIAAANFVAVLDSTIANVSLSTISGALGSSTSQGTYVITSYAVAEAITVPLTGWLASRFGTVRVFITALVMFGLFSALCGMATSLGTLILYRVFQGLAGGPLMPLSQTLLLRIFPKEKAAAALGLWSMTTLIAPVMGPVLGGIICDDYHWSYIFFINVPVSLICGYAGWMMLKRFESEKIRMRIDTVGLVLLIIWVSALQIMVDDGKDKDWFSSMEIRVLAIVAVIGFLAFLIWELTERNPIVDLRVFRHRGFAASVVTMSLAFGAYFGATVLTPLWLQNNMGYTATWAGYAQATTGIFAVVAAPFAARLSTKFDGRWLVFAGVMLLGSVTLFRTHANSDMDFWQVALPLLLQGIGLPFFFVPTTSIGLSSVDEPETASAAGLMSFCRTFSGAIATSVVNTLWEDKTKFNRAELSGLVDQAGHFMSSLTGSGWSADQAQAQISNMVESQAVMLATNQLFFNIACCFIIGALAIWLAPKPTRVADTSQAH
ncbi:DHA2 family efflux MFS transporter permease subunit [Paraburkholderia sp. UCT31]|uniref:DHA2 family efflux MFS transporter permease subunit n=2 Tax=unclassified Paraburkholderia TaxID=2615204 RepID=UPI00292A57CD|nr:DHA2 family efflux MFS transporter permease subunit [Paraburkholderia sp. UCT31]MBC8740749.1 DHA2 family efflux MFS transporter permease subunit [Paraburkholderia sp. UCT31]